MNRAGKCACFMLTFAAFGAALSAVLLGVWWACLTERKSGGANFPESFHLRTENGGGVDPTMQHLSLATSTDLNSILQQVARYADLARRHRGEHNYIDLLGERIELASQTAQSLFDRVTSKILAGAARKTAAARKSEAGFAVVPPPAETDDGPRRSVRTSRKGDQNADRVPMLNNQQHLVIT